MIKVLDKGYVELQDKMGNDLAIVNAARISHLGDTKGDVSDKKLLFWLMEERHTSPFEMVEFKFRVKCPLFVARQWFRHRTWSYNEISRRYTSKSIEFHIPDKWRRQSNHNKQSSSGNAKNYSDLLEQTVKQSEVHYNDAIRDGIAREQARLFLHICLYTEFIGKVNGHNLMHFLRLRMSEHAQYEIRLYAQAICDHFFKTSLPWTHEAFIKFT